MDRVAHRLLYRKLNTENLGTRRSYTESKTMVKRIKPEKVKVTTESISFKAPISAKSSQAWKYQGNRVQRAASIMINGTRYADPKDSDLPRRKHESNFFITLNTNKAMDKRELDEVEKMERTMDATLTALSKDATIAGFLKFGPKDPAYINDKYADVIHSVSWDSGIETGPERNRLHAHIWLTIEHYSQVQINVQMLQHVAKRIYNNHITSVEGATTQSTMYMRKLPFVHVKLLPQSDWTDVMKQYIHKAMATPAT